MSDASQGPGWWLASDGKWYPPEKAAPTPASAPPPPTAPVPAPKAAPPVSAPQPVPPAAVPASAAAAVPPPAGASPSMSAPPPSSPPPSQPGGGTGAAPGTPKKSGNGCLKAFVIMVCVVFVVGVGVIAVLAFVVDRVGHHVLAGANAENKVEQQTGIATNPLGFDSAHPPQKDVYGRRLDCSVDGSGLATAKGSVFNHSGHPSAYVISVNFLHGSTVVGDGGTVVFNVPAGGAVDFQASGSVGDNKSVTCKVDSILRSSNPKLAPSTTTTD